MPQLLKGNLIRKKVYWLAKYIQIYILGFVKRSQFFIAAEYKKMIKYYKHLN